MTIATALKSVGYATGQFGKNHLGDRNEFLPTVHGFDEFFGYLYHLDAMEDPAHPNYPQDLLDKVGPRNMARSFHFSTTDAYSTTETIRSVCRRKSSTTAIIFWRTGASSSQVCGTFMNTMPGLSFGRFDFRAFS